MSVNVRLPSPLTCAFMGMGCHALGELSLRTAPYSEDLKLLLSHDPFSVMRGGIVGYFCHYWYRFLQTRIYAIETIPGALEAPRWKTIMLRSVADQAPTLALMASTAIVVGWTKAVVETEMEARKEWGAFQRYYEGNTSTSSTTTHSSQLEERDSLEEAQQQSLLSTRSKLRSQPQPESLDNTTNTSTLSSFWRGLTRRWTYRTLQSEQIQSESTPGNHGTEYPKDGRYMEYINSKFPHAAPSDWEGLYEWQKKLKELEHQSYRKKVIDEDIHRRITRSYSWLFILSAGPQKSASKLLEPSWWQWVFLRPAFVKRRREQEAVPLEHGQAYLPVKPSDTVSRPRLDRLRLILQRLESTEMDPRLLKYNFLVSQLNFALAQPRWQPAIGILQNLIMSLFGSVASNENQWLSVERRLVQKVKETET
eukprot:gb/GECG01000688.1/.p1 GENE.gb/GECG01000688.1/~~gb/GECG01000688.1/.p1  ORF type:complete len:423 (+),score=37.92 gb/GECG01000688.1/:1-1269(+)